MIAPQDGHLFHRPSGMSDFFFPSDLIERFLKIPITKNRWSVRLSVCGEVWPDSHSPPQLWRKSNRSQPKSSI
jgi:hypothetical protein